MSRPRRRPVDGKGECHMLDPKISKLLNEQVNKEFYSAYFYLGMYSFYSDANLTGFANWFHVQMQEERDHAMLFVQYLLNNDEKLVLTDIKSADLPFSAFDDPLRATLQHERTVTASINTIYDTALTAKDFKTTQFLDWFVKEQGEEEKNATDLIKRFKLFGQDPKGLYSLDSELAARVYAAPTLVL